jgi:hypothetical protein
MPDTPTPPPSVDSDFGRTLVGPPASHILETEVKGDLSLYDAEQEKVLVLNSTATDVWLLCDGEYTVDRIVELVAAAHGQKAAVVRDDVETTIRQFLEEGFLSS